MTSEEIPPRLISAPNAPPLGAENPCRRVVMINDKPNITQQTVKMVYVTGEVCGSQRARVLLAAAKENVMLAPHVWHFVAVAPTSVPHDGHSLGRSGFGSDRNISANCPRQRSSL